MYDTPVLYTINSCSRCQIVKNHLLSMDIDFSEVNLSQTPDRHRDLKAYIGEVYVPLFIYGNRIIKGDCLEEINKILIQSGDRIVKSNIKPDSTC
ncbi:glutaredoxin family protein [Pseudalkalibacillus sp. SCS-8]|uniref:glutaredoxin family protein n=1 Tax=Pseudalkalibacillus nanhaiensis TaxID=3115291 RepID=UPI0032D9E5E6